MEKRKVKVMSLLLCVVMLLTLLTGCETTKQETTKEKVDGTTINIGESVDFSSFDPFGIGDGQGFFHYSPLVYETLIRFENGEPTPGLAKSWSSDGNKWTFELKEGIKFTDGEVFNAEAVKVNIEKMQELQGEQLSYYMGVAGITNIEIPEENTIVFVYESPYYPVLQELSAIPFGMMSPAVFEGGNNPYGNITDGTYGTGAYELKKEGIDAGKSYTFTRNENYYEETAGPDRFTVKIVPDEDSRLLAMQAGEIDVLYGSHQITSDMFDTLKGTEGVTAELSDTAYATRNLLLNTTNEVLADVKVRQALHYGANKQQIVDSILHGSEEKADYLFAKTVPFCDIEMIVYDYDEEKANKLLEEAGWTEKNEAGIRVKDGQTLTFVVIYMSERSADEQILTAFKGQMEEIGVEIDIQGYETMTWYEKGMEGAFDLSVNDTYVFPQDPFVFVAAMLDYGLDYPAQLGLTQKEKIDEHISSMLGTTDEAQIQEDLTYVLTTLQEEAVNLPISYQKERCVYNTAKIASVEFDMGGVFFDVSKVKLK